MSTFHSMGGGVWMSFEDDEAPEDLSEAVEYGDGLSSRSNSASPDEPSQLAGKRPRPPKVKRRYRETSEEIIARCRGGNVPSKSAQTVEMVSSDSDDSLCSTSTFDAREGEDTSLYERHWEYYKHNEIGPYASDPEGGYCSERERKVITVVEEESEGEQIEEEDTKTPTPTPESEQEPEPEPDDPNVVITSITLGLQQPRWLKAFTINEEAFIMWGGEKVTVSKKYRWQQLADMALKYSGRQNPDDSTDEKEYRAKRTGKSIRERYMKLLKSGSMYGELKDQKRLNDDYFARFDDDAGKLKPVAKKKKKKKSVKTNPNKAGKKKAGVGGQVPSKRKSDPGPSKIAENPSN